MKEGWRNACRGKLDLAEEFYTRSLFARSEFSLERPVSKAPRKRDFKLEDRLLISKLCFLFLIAI